MLVEQPELFDEEHIQRMVHRNAMRTEVDAARNIQPKLSALQQAVLLAFQEIGPMNDRELERLERFSTSAPSTIRKRRTELYQAGKLRAAGARDGLTLWELAGLHGQADQ